MKSAVLPDRVFVLISFAALLSSGLSSFDARQVLGNQGVDARALVKKSLLAVNRDVQTRTSYTYREQVVVHELEKNGQTHKTEQTEEEIIWLGGKPYHHLLSKDGKPLAPSEAKREEQKLNRAAAEASRLTPEERTARTEKWKRDRAKENEWMQFVPDAYLFVQEADQTRGGRATHVIRAAARPDYHGKFAHILSRAAGVLFIDAHDFTITRLEVNFLDDVTFGLFIARLSKGAHFTFEQKLINGEVWLPAAITVQAAGRALIKTVRADVQINYSNYRKFQSESRIVSDSE